MSRPNTIGRYSVTLTAAHFPAGDETYDLGVELEDGETIVAVGIDTSVGWDVDAPTISPTTLVITGADDGPPSAGTVEAWALIASHSYAVTLDPPEVPD